jgi:hypothetical protein
MKALLSLFFLLALSSPALAEPAISCHCFRDRSFDAQRPEAADPYLLATTRNSLLAAAFGIDKKEIVRSRMSGTSGEDMWIAHFVARRTGIPAAELLSARGRASSWRAVLVPLKPDPERVGPRFTGALAAGAQDASLADAAADSVLETRLGVPPEVLLKLRAAGASTREIVFCVFLAGHADRPAAEFWAEAQSGRRSWGQILDGLGITAAAIEGEVRKMLL